jgi:hypothetical protein
VPRNGFPSLQALGVKPATGDVIQTIWVEPARGELVPIPLYVTPIKVNPFDGSMGKKIIHQMDDVFLVRTLHERNEFRDYPSRFQDHVGVEFEEIVVGTIDKCQIKLVVGLHFRQVGDHDLLARPSLSLYRLTIAVKITFATIQGADHDALRVHSAVFTEPHSHLMDKLLA